MTMIRTERDAIEVELTKAGIAASREMYVIERFEKDPPTGWTLKHRRVNDLLDEWELEATGG